MVSLPVWVDVVEVWMVGKFTKASQTAVRCMSGKYRQTCYREAGHSAVGS